MHGGMSYARLEDLGGIQWPCPDEITPASCSSRRLWERPRGRPAGAVQVVVTNRRWRLDEEFPLRLTTGRRLDSYNTGVQTAGYVTAAAGGDARPLARGRGALAWRTARSSASAHGAARERPGAVDASACGRGWPL